MQKIEIFQNVFWYRWIQNWPLTSPSFLLIILAGFFTIQMGLLWSFKPEALQDVWGLRLMHSVILAFTIAAPVVLVSYLERDARDVLAIMPDRSLATAVLTKGQVLVAYIIGLCVGSGIGVMIDGWYFFLKPFIDLSVALSSFGLLLIMGPSAVFQYYGAWRLCRWLARAAADCPVDLLRVNQLEVFVRPVFRLAALAAVSIGIGPFAFLLNKPWSDFGLLVIALALVMISSMLPFFIWPALTIGKKIRLARMEELERINAYFGGDTATLGNLIPARLTDTLSFSDVIAWRSQVENMMSFPIRQSLRRNLLLFVLPVLSWSVAIVVDILF